MNRNLFTVRRRWGRFPHSTFILLWLLCLCAFAPHRQTRTDRLADYFVVAGVGDRLLSADHPAEAPGEPVLFHPDETSFHGTVLSRYPYEAEWEDTPFPQGIVLFCFPNAVRLLRPPSVGEPLPTFFTFVATGTGGVQLYGHCLTFYERLTAEQAACLIPTKATYFAPKCMVILSRWCFPEFRDVLSELYRLSLSDAPLPLERVICNFMSEVPLPPAGKVAVQYAIGSTEVTFQRAPLNKRLSPVGLQFQNVFECLSVHNLELIFRCLLTERQVGMCVFV